MFSLHLMPFLYIPELCANWYRNFQEDKNIVIENLENIREEDSEQYKNLKRQDIHSLVVVPLYWEKKIIGFYGVDNPPAESLDYVSDMLHIMGSFIVSSIRRRNLLRQLERMSYRDQLTCPDDQPVSSFMPLLIIDLFQPCDIAVHYTDLFPIPLMLRQLERMSYRDQLTQFGNRYAVDWFEIGRASCRERVC